MRFAVIAVLLTTAVCNASQGDVRPLVRGDARFEQLQSTAAVWKRGVAQRDVGALSNLAWPEYRASVRRDLLDRTSALYRSLFDEDNDVRRAIVAADNSVRIFEKIDGDATVDAFAVCYEPGNAVSAWPTEFVKILNLRQSGTFCSYWVREPEGLFLSYDWTKGRRD